MQLVYLALPCGFVSVEQAPMQNRSDWSFVGICVNWFRRVVQARAYLGERARIKNAKL